MQRRPESTDQEEIINNEIPSGQEIREAEKKPKVFMVYRENDTYKQQAPFIEKELGLLDRQVIVQEFPRETKEDEIKEWMRANQETTKDTEIISDSTCEWAGDLNPYLNLDQMNDQILDQIVLSDKIKIDGHSIDSEESPENQLERERALFSAIFDLIQEKTEKRIKELYIIREQLSDHSASAAETAAESGHSLSKSKLDRLYGKQLKQWAEEKGIEAQNIGLPKALPEDLLENKGAYILYDRHLATSSYHGESFENAWGEMDKETAARAELFISERGLPLPFGDLYREANRKFGFTADNEEAEAIIREALKKVFGDQEK